MKKLLNILVLVTSAISLPAYANDSGKALVDGRRIAAIVGVGYELYLGKLGAQHFAAAVS